MESMEPTVHLDVDTVIKVLHVTRRLDTVQLVVTLDGNGRICFAIQVRGILIFELSITLIGCTLSETLNMMFGFIYFSCFHKDTDWKS